MNGILNPAQRKLAYAIYAIAGVIIGAAQAALAVYGLSDVKWLVATLAVYSFLGGAFGFVAANNTGDPIGEPVAPDEAVETDVPEDEAEPIEWAEDDDDDDEAVLEPEDYDALDAHDAALDEVDDTPPAPGYTPQH